MVIMSKKRKKRRRKNKGRRLTENRNRRWIGNLRRYWTRKRRQWWAKNGWKCRKGRKKIKKREFQIKTDIRKEERNWKWYKCKIWIWNYTWMPWYKPRKSKK